MMQPRPARTEDASTPAKASLDFDSLVHHGPLLVVLCRTDTTERVDFISENVSLLGYAAASFTDGEMTLSAAIHPDDLARVQANTSVHLASELREFSQAYRLLTASGEPRWVEDRSTVIRDAAGEVTHLQHVIADVTEYRRAKGVLQFHNHILDNMAEGVVLARTSDGRIVYLNPAYAQMFGYRRAELLARHISTLHAETQDTPGASASKIIKPLQHTPDWHGKIRCVRKDGSTFWTWANISTFDDPDHGEVRLSVQQDITAHERAQEQLRLANSLLSKMAHTDSLTGLPNRRSLFQVLARELDRIARYGGSAALVMIDVDDLKSVNDSHGHLFGDEVLAHVAIILQNHARTSDFVARYGGDEFVILLPNTSPEEAAVAVRRMRDAVLNGSDSEKDGALPITISAGIALVVQGQGDSATDLLRKADGALYAAKAAGRNCVHTVESPV